MRQSGHAAGEVARVHGKRDGLGFEEALEDSREGAGLLILQRVISFCEDWISARVELQLCNQERTVAIAVHCFEPCAQRRGQLVRGETDDPPKFRHIALHVDAQQLEEDRLFALEIGIDCALRVAGLRRYQVNRRAAVSVACKDPLGRGKQPLPG